MCKLVDFRVSGSNCIAREGGLVVALTEEMGKNDRGDDGGLQSYGPKENSNEDQELDICHHSHSGFKVGCGNSVDLG